MFEITAVLGIDIAGIEITKGAFNLHGVVPTGKVVLKKQFPRTKLSAFIACFPPCLIVMESCSGANEYLKLPADPQCVRCDQANDTSSSESPVATLSVSLGISFDAQ